MSNEEQGIFQPQVRAASARPGGRDGLRDTHRHSAVYLDERIAVYLQAAAAFERRATAHEYTAGTKS